MRVRKSPVASRASPARAAASLLDENAIFLLQTFLQLV